MAKTKNMAFCANATATCSNCKSTYILDMAQESIVLDICGNCHPVYTGQEVLVDVDGRIERFNKKASKVVAYTSKKAKKAKARKVKQNLVDLSPKESKTDTQQVDAKPETSNQPQETQETQKPTESN